jgi:hypothetical protein
MQALLPIHISFMGLWRQCWEISFKPAFHLPPWPPPGREQSCHMKATEELVLGKQSGFPSQKELCGHCSETQPQWFGCRSAPPSPHTHQMPCFCIALSAHDTAMTGQKPSGKAPGLQNHLCVEVISNPNKPVWKPHNLVVTCISYVPGLGRCSAILTISPIIRLFATCGFSWPHDSAPSWLPPPPPPPPPPPSLSQTSRPTFPFHCPITGFSFYWPVRMGRRFTWDYLIHCSSEATPLEEAELSSEYKQHYSNPQHLCKTTAKLPSKEESTQCWYQRAAEASWGARRELSPEENKMRCLSSIQVQCHCDGPSWLSTWWDLEFP